VKLIYLGTEFGSWPNCNWSTCRVKQLEYRAISLYGLEGLYIYTLNLHLLSLGPSTVNPVLPSECFSVDFIRKRIFYCHGRTVETCTRMNLDASVASMFSNCCLSTIRILIRYLAHLCALKKLQNAGSVLTCILSRLHYRSSVLIIIFTCQTKAISLNTMIRIRWLHRYLNILPFDIFAMKILDTSIRWCKKIRFLLINSFWKRVWQKRIST